MKKLNNLKFKDHTGIIRDFKCVEIIEISEIKEEKVNKIKVIAMSKAEYISFYQFLSFEGIYSSLPEIVKNFVMNDSQEKIITKV